MAEARAAERRDGRVQAPLLKMTEDGQGQGRGEGRVELCHGPEDSSSRGGKYDVLQDGGGRAYRLSPCPRSRAFPALPARFSLSHKWQNNWWKCHVNVIVQTGDIPVGAGGIVGIEGHHGFFRGQSSSSSAEQTVDIPVPGRLRGGLQGFSPGHGSGQRSVEQNVQFPVPRRGGSEGLRGFSPGHGSGRRSAEQNVVIPVPFGGRPLHAGQDSAAFTEQLVDTGDFHGFPPGQSSTAFAEQLAGQGSGARRGARVCGGGAQGSVPGQGSTAPRGAQSCVGRQSRRFTGRIWTLPAAGEYGFIESDSAKAAFGHTLVRYPFPHQGAHQAA